jgi:hypothetical protein
VLVVRGQQFTPPQFIAAAQIFGELFQHDKREMHVPGYPQLHCVSNEQTVRGDLHQNRGYDSLRVAPKGGQRDALAINPQTAARIRANLEASGHPADIGGPMFRPPKHNGKQQAPAHGP